MFFFTEPALKGALEPYTRAIFPNFSAALLVIYGIVFASVLFFVNKKHKQTAVLAGSLIFIMLSSTVAHFLLFLAVVSILYCCSSYDFRFRKLLFWIAEGVLIASNMVLYRIFGHYSAVYSFAAYYTVYKSVQYFVDVGQGSLQKSGFMDYLGFIYYFPNFSSPPVERKENVAFESLSRKNIFFGLKRMVWGCMKFAFLFYAISYVEMLYFEKAVFSLGGFWQWASGLAGGGPVKAHHTAFSWQDKWEWLFFAAYLGAIKLYIELSAMVDIVIGVSCLIGIRLSENFPKFPYIQRSLTKFWQNWQATIVNWLTAYVYFPLCRNRKYVYAKTMLIIMIIGWAHLFYSLDVFNFRNFGHLISFVMYYTLWGVFLGGMLALSKIISKKKADSKESISKNYPSIAKIVYADNMLTKAVAAFVTFNIIAIGWLSPLYILLAQITGR